MNCPFPLKTKRFFVVLVLTLFSAITHIQAKLIVNANGLTELDESLAVSLHPYDRIVVSTDDGIIVTYRFNYFEATPDYYGYRLSVYDFDDIATEGYPALLQKMDVFNCPREAAPTFKLLHTNYVDVELPLTSSEPPVCDCDEPIFPFNTPITPYKGFLPIECVSNMTHQKSRNESIIWVNIFPFNYSMSDSTLRLCTEISYEIYFNSPSPKSKINSSVVLPDSGFIVPPLNPNLGYPIRYRSADESYLIITIPEYVESECMREFVSWKKKQGYHTHVASKQSWTPIQVLDTVKSHFNANNNLQYILIVGDFDAVPAKKVLCRNKFIISDRSYGCIDDENLDLPIISRGRWPITSLKELETIVSKTIAYESNPPTFDDFYSTATHLAYFEDSNLESPNGISINRLYSAIPISQNTDTRYLGPKEWRDGYSFPSLLRVDSVSGLKGYSWDKSFSDFVKCIENGRLYALYRGHGSQTGWNNKVFTDPNYGKLFTSDDVRALQEQLHASVIFSITCLTGKFSEDCFANSWLTSKGGSVAVIAQSDKSFSGTNDILTMELFSGLWEKETIKTDLKFFSAPKNRTKQYRIGCPVDSALMRMIRRGNLYALETSNLTHYFGDPSMILHTSLPKKIENVEITRESSKVKVYTGSFAGYISLYDMTTDKVCRFYGNYGDIKSDNPEKVSVHIEKDGYYPFFSLGAEEPEVPPVVINQNRIINIVDNLNQTITVHYTVDDTVGLPYLQIVGLVSSERIDPGIMNVGEGLITLRLSPGYYNLVLYGTKFPQRLDERSILVK